MELGVADMKNIQEGSFDLVVACDVLEHVPRDREAMQEEVRRILARGGCAILTVPQCAAHEVTLWHAGVTDPCERLFGQADQVRMYGLDFPARLADVGFHVQIRSAADLPRDLVTRHVLVPPVPSAHPLPSNDRRLFFARRDRPEA
jgi:SAM-dependent methyltransferase